MYIQLSDIYSTCTLYLTRFSLELTFSLQQTEILQLVFATYFRILKNSRHSPLLQPVLEGLAK